MDCFHKVLYGGISLSLPCTQSVFKKRSAMVVTLAACYLEVEGKAIVELV